MKQQIIVSGLGGQGALTLTRLLAEAAAALGLPVITSETHGMAQRGGTVISMIKVGPFRGPLIPAGEADRGLFLHPKNVAVHRFYLRDGAAVFVNAALPGDYLSVDARSLAAAHGLASGEEYASACHLCYRVRQRLRPHMSEWLAPAQVYGA